MSAAQGRKAYGAFLGALALAVSFGVQLSYSGVQGSDARIWIGLYWVALVFQVVVTGQLGFENRKSEANSSEEEQNEGYVYCGAVFEEAEDPLKQSRLSQVLSQELMLLRVLGLAMTLGAYVYCLRKLEGFSFHGLDVLMLLGVASILFASTLRHFVFALGLNASCVVVRLVPQISNSSTSPWTAWGLIGVYVFFLVFTLQLHRILDLEVNDPEANFFQRPRKQREVAWSSVLLTAFVLSLLLLSNAIIPRENYKKPELRNLERVQTVNHQSPPSLKMETPRVSITREEAQRVLQLLQSKTEAGSNGKDTQSALASQLELEGLMRKDMESRSSQPESQQQQQQVELSKDTLASMERVLQSAASQAQAQAQAQSQTQIQTQSQSQSQAQSQSDLSKSNLNNSQKDLADLAKALQEIHAKQTLAQAQPQPQASSQSQLSSQQQSQSQGNAPIQAMPDQAYQLQSKSKPPSNDVPVKTKNHQKIIEKALVFLAFCMACLFISKLLRKRVRPEDISGETFPELSADERALLKKEWKELQKRSTSAREEVIACYHFFLKLMTALGHTRPESLPPYEYATGLHVVFPVESKAIYGITDIFCDVFYGRENPEPSGMKSFRDQFQMICRKLI